MRKVVEVGIVVNMYVYIYVAVGGWEVIYGRGENIRTNPCDFSKCDVQKCIYMYILKKMCTYSEIYYLCDLRV